MLSKQIYFWNTLTRISTVNNLTPDKVGLDHFLMEKLILSSIQVFKCMRTSSINNFSVLAF